MVTKENKNQLRMLNDNISIFRAIFFIVTTMLSFSFLYSETIAQPPTNFNDPDAGTVANPFLISNLANLRWLSETNQYWGGIRMTGGIQINKYYFSQTADIDAAETQFWYEGLGFRPIGGLYVNLNLHFFASSYNGNNFKISNLHFNRPLGHRVGMFGWAEFAELHNIVIENINIQQASADTGALLATGFDGNTIQNSSASGSISTVVVNLQDPPAVGGLVGLFRGSHDSSLSNSYSTVNLDVVSDFRVGGVIGQINGSPTINNLFYMGIINNLDGIPEVGGLFGRTASAVIENCYAVSSGNSPNMGGISHTTTNTSIFNSFWNYYTSETLLPVYNVRDIFWNLDTAIGEITKALKTVDTYIQSGWDFENIWAINQNFNSGYPFLRVMHPDVSHIPYQPEDDNYTIPLNAPINYYEPKSGTVANPFLISSLNNLKWLSENNTQWWRGLNTHIYFLQTDDIDATETINWNGGAGFEPIGHITTFTLYPARPVYAFVGGYDGNDFTISNLFINKTLSNVDSVAGMFYRLTNNSFIKKLNLEDFDFRANTPGSVSGSTYVGGLVGFLVDSTIMDCSVTGSFIKTGYPNYASGDIGGFIGIARRSIIKNISIDMNVNFNMSGTSFYNIGGMIGAIAENSTLSNASMKGSTTVFSDSFTEVGGIVGQGSSIGGSITNSYSTSDVTVSSSSVEVGGIAGTIKGNFTVSYSYSTGEIKATGITPNSRARSGGISGANYNAIIINCYSTGDISATSGFGSAGRAYAGGISGITIANDPNSSPPIVSFSYAIGEINISSPNPHVGGIIGSLYDGQVLHCFWDLETTGMLYATNDFTPPTNFGLPTLEMKNIVNYLNNGWDFVEIWGIEPEINEGYPFLRIISDEDSTIFYPPNNLEGSIILLDNLQYKFLSNKAIFLSWEAPNEGSSGIFDHFKLYRDGIVISNNVLENSFVDSDIVYDTMYSYYVTAFYVDIEGESIPSNIITIKIEIEPIPNPVLLMTPENEAVEVKLRPVFTWELPTEGGEIEGLRFYIDIHHHVVSELASELVINNVTLENPIQLSNDSLPFLQKTHRGKLWHYMEAANHILLPPDTTEYTLEIDLEYETTYYWQVIAFNENGDSIDNQVFSFMTRGVDIESPPNPVALLNPDNEADEVELRPVFAWELPTEGGEIAGLRFYIDIHHHVVSEIASVLMGNNVTLENPIQSSSATPPFLQKMHRGDCFVPRNWHYMEAANHILLPPDTTEYTLEIDLEYETTYYWQVIAFNENGDSIDNQVFSFMTRGVDIEPPPEPVVLLTPVNETDEVELRPVFTWELPTEGGEIAGLRFYIDIHHHVVSELASVLVGNNPKTHRDKLWQYMEAANHILLPPDTTEYTLEIDLEYETTYYWQIIAFNENGDSLDNQVFRFTTIKYSSDQNEYITPLITELLGNFPNPFNPETTIRFSVGNAFVSSEPIHVSIDIYNIRGQKIKSLVNDFRISGEHQVIWNGTDDFGHAVRSGVYFYQMTTDDYRETKRMLMLK
ncbi:MAG: T9SS type A sorting domain-containing protein [Candidatus Cloacimonetes bacterium]|nr:T9SS type A sorting domain-containing protein [Candidatus Cloacimonadota bacterium]